jgi:DNA-binding response OmpR family regulator
MAMARSVAPPVPNSGNVALGNLLLKFDTFSVSIAGEHIPVTYQEFEILRVLASQPDRIIPFDDLTGVLWQAAGRTYKRRLNVVIHRLRSKLDRSNPYQIIAVRLRGYGLLSQSAVTRKQEA